MSLVDRLFDAISEVRVVAKGEAAGLKLSAPRADPNFGRGTYELPMQEAIASNLSEESVFFDVGANIGFFSLIAARRVGRQGRVYAFEPVPANAATIARNAHLNDFDTIEVFTEAVGAKAARAEFVLARHIGGGSLAAVGIPPDGIGRVEVEVVTLDEEIRRRGLRPPSLVKIDVEGAELEVLSGMAETLAVHRPLIIYEIDDASRQGLERKRRQLAEFMTAAGYTVASLPLSYPENVWHVEHVLARPALERRTRAVVYED